jgi:hypothetical protein
MMKIVVRCDGAEGIARLEECILTVAFPVVEMGAAMFMDVRKTLEVQGWVYCRHGAKLYWRCADCHKLHLSRLEERARQERMRKARRKVSDAEGESHES